VVVDVCIVVGVLVDVCAVVESAVDEVVVEVEVGDVDVVAVVAVVVVVVVGQFGAMMLLSSRLTWPLRASTRPATVDCVCTVASVSARMLPTNVVSVPSVAELPTCQKTLHGSTPLMIATLLFDAVIRVDGI
jgi:hypothetical protein